MDGLKQSMKKPSDLLLFITTVTVSENEVMEMEGMSEEEQVTYMSNIEEIRNAKAEVCQKNMTNEKKLDLIKWAASIKNSALGKMLEL